MNVDGGLKRQNIAMTFRYENAVTINRFDSDNKISIL